MAYLNSVNLIGAVGNDPEVRTVQGGAKVATLRLATTERYKDRDGNQHEDTEWHTIVIWNGKADFVEKYIRKGANLFVSGKLRTRKWDDNDGRTRYSTEIVADNIQMLDRKQRDNATAPAQSNDDDDLPEFFR